MQLSTAQQGSTEKKKKKIKQPPTERDVFSTIKRQMLRWCSGRTLFKTGGSIDVRDGLDFEALAWRAIIHSGALLQPLHISFFLCRGCHALWDVATGLSRSRSSRGTLGCRVYTTNTGSIICLSHHNREQMDSPQIVLMLYRCHRAGSHTC